METKKLLSIDSMAKVYLQMQNELLAVRGDYGDETFSFLFFHETKLLVF